jgi:hypothetical protein
MVLASPRGGPIVDSGDNAYAIDALRRRLAANPNVLPFVGAGLSRPFGYPDWREFLDMGAKAAHKEREVARLADEGDYESAMSVIHDELAPINYHDFLRTTFGPRTPPPGTWDAAVRFLPALPRTPIITVNIDEVIEQVFEEHGTRLDVIVGARRERFIAALEERQRALIKLHGDYRDATDRILTLEDYNRHYGLSTRASRTRQPFLGIVQNLLAGNSFLFLGFGMEERTQKLLQSVAKAGALHTHWIVMPRTAEARGRAKELGQANVRILWYEPGDHAQIATFLHWFAVTASPEGSPVRRVYASIDKKDFVAALTAGEEAVAQGYGDPALDWNLSVTAEYAARQILEQGKVDEAMTLLAKSVQDQRSDPRSAVALRWAVSYVLRLGSDDSKAPTRLPTGTVEILDLLRSALTSPDPGLLTRLGDRRAVASDRLREVLTLLCSDGQAEVGSSVARVPAGDPLLESARRAEEAQRASAQRAEQASGRLRRTKKLFFKGLAMYSGHDARTARRALVAREILLLTGLEARRAWFDEGAAV